MENVSALFETVLLLVTCGWIIWEAIERLVARTAHVDANVWSFAVVAVAIVIDFSRSRALSRVAKKHASQALEADALHFASDIWTSLTVMVGLAFVSMGYPSLDAVAAMVVALLVLFVSYRLGRRTIDALMDRVPLGLSKKVEESIKKVDGVEELRSMRVRMSGAKAFVDATIGIRRTLPLEHAHRVMDDVEKAVHAIQSGADVTVHAEPLRGQDETIIDKIRMVVVNKGLGAPHNLEVHQSGGKHFIDFDIEYSKDKTFVEAHSLAEEIELQIRKEIPSVEKVTIHLEEFLPAEGEPLDVTAEEKDLCRAIESVVLADPRIRGCSDITVLKHEPNLHVTLSCQLESSRTLADVHQVIGQVEAQLYQSFPHVQPVHDSW